MNTECSWHIHTLNPPWIDSDDIVKVTFEDFELEGDNPDSCVYDSLKFYDGQLPQQSSFLGSYCGTVRPDVIYSRGKYLVVKFHSNPRNTYRGFSLRYTAVKKGRALLKRLYFSAILLILNLLKASI